MALKDMLAAPPVRENPSKVASWRATLDTEDRAAFDAAVRNPAWTNSGLARMLTTAGFKVDESSIRRYRERLA
ncbi:MULTISPECIES: hypothetical protein [unclassified Microbacterium]|uniref:hypothetical protein n=1 Tax=unclassified Microbacterium TaxID=2609290 RepID=UPI0030188970